jgi:hypothetical protein
LLIGKVQHNIIPGYKSAGIKFPLRSVVSRSYGI